ncbi:MAG: Gmad2 immunoglobulin-like domain-containing protein [Candidatus Microthrix parvicella]
MGGSGVRADSGGVPGRFRWRRLAMVSAMVLGLAGVVACGDGASTEVTATAPDAGAAPSPAGESSWRAASETRVYFAWNEKVGAAGRSSSPATPEGAIEALLKGPDAFETDIGMTSAIPDATKLLGVSVSGGTAVVDLSGAFQTGGGSLSMQLRVAQVVFTATQFDEVDRVTIHLDGAPVDGIGGEGVPATEVDRNDSANVTPAVLVESPTPGANVASPLAVSGISNTFEATVNYSIADGDGLIVAEGHTTTTAGNGTWGDFEFTETFENAKPGLGAVIAFQEDAEKGGQRDVYEVPVRFGATPPSSAASPPDAAPTPTSASAPAPPPPPPPPPSGPPASAVFTG